MGSGRFAAKRGGDDIVAECEDDNDLDVQYWHPLPKALTK